MNPPSPPCGACGERHTKLIAPITLYVKDGTVEDAVWKCPACGTWIRAADFNDPRVSSHFDVASFTKPENEAQFRKMRAQFFRRLVALGARQAGKPPPELHLLDVGPSYGHLLEGAKSDGVPVADGMERVQRLRDRLQSRGFTVFETIDAIPADHRYDLITLIDCLYCFQHPAPLLEKLRSHLTPNGVLLVRVTNKTRLLNLVRRLGRPITSDLVCGDAKHNFTPRGIRMLLECTGFRIELLTGKESGKKLPTLRAFFLHHSLYWLSLITRRPVALGMVIVARPAMALESPTNKEGAESAP